MARALPLLTGASCHCVHHPRASEESGVVLRGTRAGSLGNGAEATDFRLENPVARRTGPAAYTHERHPDRTGPLPIATQLEVTVDEDHGWTYETALTLVLPDDASIP